MTKTKNKSFVGSISSNLPPLTKNQILFFAVLAVVTVLYLARGLFVAAIVNGQPITRIAIISELERQLGKDALDATIDKTLILQEAKRQNVKITKQDLDDDIAEIETSLSQQGQSFDQLLTFQGMTKDEFIEQLKVQKTVQELLGKDIVVIDEEVDKFFEENKASLPQGTDEAVLKNNIREQLKSQQISDKYQVWIEELRNSAKIYTFVDY